MWETTKAQRQAAETLAAWLGPITPENAGGALYAAMMEAAMMADQLEYEEMSSLPVSADTADAIADWLVDSLSADLACGAGYCAPHDWAKIAQIELLTGRNLHQEAQE